MKKIYKLIQIIRLGFFPALLRNNVAAGVEHSAVLASLKCNHVVDIGANRGQFALIARKFFPDAKIDSFEPLPAPAEVFRLLFANDREIVLHNAAIGPKADRCDMHLSARDDSSSLLPISSLQGEVFPGTNEVGTVSVRVAPLDTFMGKEDLANPAMLKLDVQGFELDALRGCESLLPEFDWVYCECSFMELYSGQKLAADVIDWLSKKDFKIKGIYNPTYDHEGVAVQADLLFQRSDMDTV